MIKKERIGSVYYDKKDKRWKCIYYAIDSKTQQEKRRCKSFIVEQEARDFLTSIQYQKGNRLYIQNNGIPLNKLMREINDKKLDANIITERTYARHIKTIETIERGAVSHKNINDITSTEVQNYLNTLKDYSLSTIKKIKEQFSKAFEEAINKGYISRNPMKEIIQPRSTKVPKVVRALEIEEQQKVTNYLMSVPLTVEPYKLVYLLQMYLGLRIGEALALRSTDINLQKNLITVDKTLSTDKNEKIIMKYMPKTSAGIREIPIPKFIIEEVINQMRIAEYQKDRQLFLDSKGNYAKPNNVSRRLTTVLETMGIHNISSHNLRHTYGTRCIEAGMRAVALQRLMGHADVSITLNTYTSVFNQYKEAELEKVNQYYMNNAIINNNISMQKGNINYIDIKKNNSIDNEMYEK